MRNILFATAFAAAGLTALPAFAQDTSASLPGYLPGQAIGSGNWFIDANVGRTNSGNGGFGSNFASNYNFTRSQHGRRTGYGLLGGYRWKLGQNLALGLEGGYTDLGNFQISNTFRSGHDVNESSTQNALHGFLAGVNGRINLLTGWYLSARGGYFHANNENQVYSASEGDSLGTLTTTRPGRGSWYAGIGTGWDINAHWGVGVSYDYYHANAGKVLDTASGNQATTLKRSTGIASITGEYRF